MVRKYWSCLVCVGLLLLTATFPACKGLSTNNSDKDSDSIKLAEAVNAMLPDTAFQSVDDLIYEVEVLDTITNGELNSLQDPYQ